MALKMPIVEIPIDDSKFRRFAELFGDYEERLAKTPGVWQKVSREFRQSTAAILAQNHALKETGFGGEPTKLRAIEGFWRNAAHFSGTVLSNAIGITRTILKWGTLIGAGLLGGSLFGISRLGSDVAGYRRTAKGLGLSIGGLRSFSVNESRFVDPGSFLSAINQAVSNPALQGPLYALGVNPNGSTENVALSTLRAMRRLALNTPRGLLGTISQAYGLGPFGGLETLLRLRSTSASEFYAQQHAVGRDQGLLGLPPGVARQWQNFSTQMHLAGAEIETVFVRGLAPLTGPLTKLSQAFAGFVGRLLSGPLLRGGIDKLADYLNKFSVELASEKFQTAVNRLVSDTGTIAGAFHWLATEIRFFQHPFRSTATAVGDLFHSGISPYSMLPPGRGPSARGGFIGGAGRFGAAADQLDTIFGLPAGTMRRLIGTESSFNPNVTSAKGAMGLTQLMPAVAAQYGLRGSAAYDPRLNMIVGAEYLASLVKRFHGNLDAALAGYNLGPTKVDALMKRYGAGWEAHLPKGVGHYVAAITPDSGISVVVRHRTGANPVLASTALAATP